MIALWFQIAWAVAIAVVALRAAARARAARADLLTLVRVLEYRASRPTQSDLRATFPEFFTDKEA